MRSSVYPSLATTERVVVEVALGSEIAMLTDRRVLVAGPHFEQSVPLNHIAAVQVRFERPLRAFVVGVALVLLAALFFAIATPVESIFAESAAAALAPATRPERTNASGQGQGMQRLLKGLATAAGLLPIVAWLALAGGIAAIVLTAVGRTVATFAAGGGEISLARRGNDRALQDFVVEVGRKLPNAEASDSMLGPTVPMPGIGRP